MLLFSRVTKFSTPPKSAWNQRDSKRFKVLVLYPTTWILLLASHIVPIALRGMICKHRASKLSAPLVLSQTLKNILKMRNMIFFFLLSFSLGHAKWCSKVTAYSCQCSEDDLGCEISNPEQQYARQASYTWWCTMYFHFSLQSYECLQTNIIISLNILQHLNYMICFAHSQPRSNLASKVVPRPANIDS